MAPFPVRVMFVGRHRRAEAERQDALRQDLEEELRARVSRAAGYYATRQPGRGEYELVRLALKVANRYGDQQSADVLADLRFIQEPPRQLAFVPTGD